MWVGVTNTLMNILMEIINQISPYGFVIINKSKCRKWIFFMQSDGFDADSRD